MTLKMVCEESRPSVEGEDSPTFARFRAVDEQVVLVGVGLPYAKFGAEVDVTIERAAAKPVEAPKPAPAPAAGSFGG